MSRFSIDPRLLEDTIEVMSLGCCDLRMMNETRWPWLVLIPRIDGAIEWHELFTDQRQEIDLEISRVAGVLKALTGCRKINIAAIGNMVPQLHIHVIARTDGDPNWPGPVWGYGRREPMEEQQKKLMSADIRLAIEDGIT